MQDCGHPVDGAPRQASVRRFSLVVWGGGNLNKGGAVVEAVDIDDCA